MQLVIAYDIDPAGQAGSHKAAAALASVARRVAVADLSVLGGLPEKGDLADVLRLHGLDKLKEVLAAAKPWEGEPGGVSDGPQPVDWQEFWATDPEPIRYLVEPLIAQGEITRIFAQAKVGKSLIIQEAAAALAMGKKVLGYACEPTDVLYIDQENTWDDWKVRLADMAYGPDDDWSRFHWYSLQSWPPLDSAEGGAALLEKVQAHGAGLVVIDTQSKVLDGEEDKAPTSAAFYRHTLLPLKRLGVAVVIIDHAGNDPAKPRGSSGKRDDVDVVWQAMLRTKDKLTLKRTHTRKRHEQDVLYVNRLLSPLRHELATEDERDEEMIDACMDAILALEPRPDLAASGNTIIKDLRATKKGYRDATVREAWRRISGRQDGETP
jgi:hypothetical protein